METVKLVTAAQMRAIEQSSVEAGVSLDELMEKQENPKPRRKIGYKPTDK